MSGWPQASSNSLGFPKPARQHPETRLAGYKLNPVIQRLFPSNVATALLRPMAPPRRLRAGQWESFAFFCSAQIQDSENR